MIFDMTEYYRTPPGLQIGEAYPKGDVLGHGTFGKVYVKEDATTAVKVAVKVISKAKWAQLEVTPTHP